MGRLPKQGLAYFSFDVDFFSDVKIRKIARACGSNSTSILICLLCNIYKDKGYYILWDEDLPFVIADTVGVSEGAVKEVIVKSIQVGFFNQELYDKYKILTSNGIQSRFKSAVYKREEIEYIPEYLVSDVRNAISDVINGVSDDASTQSKVKVKVKKKKVEKEPPTPKDGGETEKINYQGLIDYFNSTFKDKLPQINCLDDRRKRAIKARVANHGKNSVMEVFKKTLDSPFLLGENDKNWRCDFDWIFKPANFIKILEGNYSKKTKSNFANHNNGKEYTDF